MTREQYEGIRFGFIFLMIWLLLLTGYMIYDKMNTGERTDNVIILPPPIENLEVVYEEF